MADLLYSWANLEIDFKEGKFGYFQGKKTSFNKHKERFPEFIWLVRKEQKKLWLLGKLRITDAVPRNFPKSHDPDFIFYDPQKSIFFDNLIDLQTEIEGTLSQACGQMIRNNFEGVGSEDILEPSIQRDLELKTQGVPTISFDEMKERINNGHLPTPPYRLNVRGADTRGRSSRVSNVTDTKLIVASTLDKEPEFNWEEFTRKIDHDCANLEGMDTDAVVKRRLGQGVFRDLLLERFGSACCMTGLTNPRLLIASHIVPWSKSTPTQKLDPDNGLLLSVSMDALFDKGLISFSNSGSILISDDLDAHAIRILGLKNDFALSKKLLTEKRKDNLAKHRERHGFESTL